MSQVPNEVRRRGAWGEEQLAASPHRAAQWCRFCGRHLYSVRLGMRCSHCEHELNREIGGFLPANFRYLAKTAEGAEAALKRLLSQSS